MAGIISACSGSTTPKKSTVCQGSALQNDPSGAHACPQPDPVSHACDPGRTQVTFPTPLAVTPGIEEAEIAVAVDPRATSQYVYVATIQGNVQPSTTSFTKTCITSKSIQVYRSKNPGTNWEVLPGTEKLPHGTGDAQNPGMWATDPDLAVASDGTLYLSFLRLKGSIDCDHGADSSNRDLQVWFAPPDGALQPALPLVDTKFGEMVPAVQGTAIQIDHPKIAISQASDSRFVIYWRDDARDWLATFQRNGSNVLSEVGARLTVDPSHIWIKPAFDSQGDLYLAAGSALRIERRHWTASGWASAFTSGAPAIAGSAAIDLITVPSSPIVKTMPDVTPAMAVTQIGNASDPIVYVAFEVYANGKREIQLAAANGNDLSHWTPTQTVPLPAGALSSFHPSLSADGPNNNLDLLAFDLEGTSGDSLQNISLKTYFYRFDLSRFSVNPSDNTHPAVVLGPTMVNQAAPSILDLPARGGGANYQAIVFTGEYIGLATKSKQAIAGFPDLSRASGPSNVDLGVAVLGDSNMCGKALTLFAPDSLWECTCSCGTLTPVVGCASGIATTAAAACPQICVGSICGAALACASSSCSATTTGHVLSSQSCMVTSGPPLGSPPASAADYIATATAGSALIFHIAGETASTMLDGQMFVNSSTSPPRAGAAAEIARFHAKPSDVFIGGSVNSQVSNITVVHPSRIRGTFTDATHFTIPPGAAEFVVTVQLGSPPPPLGSSSSDEPPAPLNIIAANPTPIAGVLDLVGGTVSLDGTAGDTSGNSIEIHYQSTITSRPPDTNQNGIIDAVDKCPGEAFGPDLTPPIFTFVPPAITLTSCTGINLGQAVATDPCGVTITNDAPSKFSLGTTIVHWTARDNAGNVAAASQEVTALLGNDVSCCPAGTHIIIGTSNNDVLVGTPGSDCILGLGGQDLIYGGGGDDYISGGDGDDTIYGQDGNDWLFGGTGQDVISGGPGSDTIYGGDGIDKLNGDDGDDNIHGGQGGDIIHGGAGTDRIWGDADDDQLYGDDGNDILVGGSGNDKLYGGNGDDLLLGEDGDDYLDGGAGSDSFDGGNGHNQCVENGAILLQCEVNDI